MAAVSVKRSIDLAPNVNLFGFVTTYSDSKLHLKIKLFYTSTQVHTMVNLLFSSLALPHSCKALQLLL